MVRYDKEELVQFIKDNKQLIINCNFDQLYSLVDGKLIKEIKVNQLTQFLVDCGVNPLDWVTDLVADMFYEVNLPEKFENLKIPDSVKSICDGAFKYCTGLTSIDHKNVESIGENAFYHCYNLTSIDLKNVTSIGNWGFALCTGLKSIDLKNVTSIGNWGFAFCTGLKSIDFKNVGSINNSAFCDCTGLKTVYAPKDLDLSKARLPEDCKIIRR